MEYLSVSWGTEVLVDEDGRVYEKECVKNSR
jgi:hypothetical protein